MKAVMGGHLASATVGLIVTWYLEMFGTKSQRRTGRLVTAPLTGAVWCTAGGS